MEDNNIFRQLRTSVKRHLDNIEYWLETNIPATPEESKNLYNDLKNSYLEVERYFESIREKEIEKDSKASEFIDNLFEKGYDTSTVPLVLLDLAANGHNITYEADYFLCMLDDDVRHGI